MSGMDTGAWNAMAQGLGLGLHAQNQRFQQQHDRDRLGFQQEQYAEQLRQQRQAELRAMARKEAMAGYLRTLYPQPEMGPGAVMGPTVQPPAPPVPPFLNGMLADLSPDDLGVIIDETHRARRETMDWERKHRERADQEERQRALLDKFGEFMTPQSRARIAGGMAGVPGGSIEFAPPAPNPADLQGLGYTPEQAKGAANLFPSAGRIMQPVTQPKTLSPEDQEFIASIEASPKLEPEAKAAIKYSIRNHNAMPWSLLGGDAEVAKAIFAGRKTMALKRVSRAEQALNAAESRLQQARLAPAEKYDEAVVGAASRTFSAAQSEYDEAMSELGKVVLDVPGAAEAQPAQPSAPDEAAVRGAISDLTARLGRKPTRDEVKAALQGGG